MALARGKQKRLIQVQQRALGTDSAGQPVDTWSTIFSAWCNPSGQNGLTSIAHAEGGVSASVSKYSLRIDYRPALDASMRVVLAGQHYRIVEARHDHEGRQWTDLVCEVGAPGV